MLVNRIVGGNKERSEGNLKRAAKHLLQIAYRPDLCIIEEHTAPATLPSGEFSVSSISQKSNALKFTMATKNIFHITKTGVDTQILIF